MQLPEPLTGKQLSLDDVAKDAPALLVMFICNHCPFVVLLKEAIVEVTKEYMERGLAAVAISSNSIKTHPQDGPEHMAADAKKFGVLLTKLTPIHLPFFSNSWQAKSLILTVNMLNVLIRLSIPIPL